MNNRIKQLIVNNQEWANRYAEEHPGIFEKLAKQQKPEYLWIGCSDSRVPANTIIGLQPGEVFVHRNIANIVNHSDLNVLSVLEYAVKVLKVKDIILCGHYGCGGVKAALERKEHGLVDNWLRVIKDNYRANRKQFDGVDNEQEELDLLCELNVVEQVKNICHSTIVQSAWLSGQQLSVHGVIYGIEDGILKDLDVTISSIDQVEAIYQLES
jgi:carbonic anhydrase